MKRVSSAAFSAFAALFIAVILTAVLPVAGQKKMDRIERETMKMMLKNIKNLIKKDYYDENFRGIDIEARFKRAEGRLDEVATTGEAFAAIAQTLMDFNDSHLYFIPPSTNLAVEYGWRHAMLGDKLFVTIVKPKSDAESKGLRAGDQILSIEGFKPARKEMWKVMYFYNVLNKRQSLRLSVLSPGAEAPREITVESKVRRLPKIYTGDTLFQLFDPGERTFLDYNHFRQVGNTMIWKMPTFSISPENVEVLYGKVKNASNLILDLRGNGGGAVVTLERLVGLIFEKDLIIAQLKGRKKFDPMQAKSKNDPFKGKLVVLIDHDSGSAAEIFARLVQLEKRGQVIGDVSSGSVLQARRETIFLGAGDEVAFAVSVTNADVIMSDGNTIENVGVTPDLVINPEGADLAAGSDPVLAEALKILGSTISPADAGQFFRLKWTETAKGDDLIEVVTK